MVRNKKTVPSWRKSKAKELLYMDIKSGVVQEGMSPEFVFGMREDYQEYKFDNFKVNLRSLLSIVQKNQERADRDALCVGNDTKVRPPRTSIAWHGSVAQKHLKDDYENGKTEDGRTPKQLHESRPEYMQFKLPVFRQQLYAIRRTKHRAYWTYLKGNSD
jgi:hypothetical protein